MSQIQEVELSIEHAKAVIRKRDIALKLADNSDFKELVLQGYLVDEAARLAHLSADLTLTAEQRSEVLQMVQAIGFFKAYMSKHVSFGNQAERDLRDAEQTLQELHAEGED